VFASDCNATTPLKTAGGGDGGGAGDPGGDGGGAPVKVEDDDAVDSTAVLPKSEESGAGGSSAISTSTAVPDCRRRTSTANEGSKAESSAPLSRRATRTSTTLILVGSMPRSVAKLPMKLFESNSETGTANDMLTWTTSMVCRKSPPVPV
jgi:hypothetical protein